MEDFDWKFISTIAAIIFAGGGVYAKLNNVESAVREIRKTLFGEDGRNGLVKDVILTKEHTEQCKAKERHSHE